jgi:hypothetical protein
MKHVLHEPRRCWAFIAALPLPLLLVCMAKSGYAQNVNAGEIRGTVTDSSGAVVPGVEVQILNTDTGVNKVLFTNDAGIYDAVSLVPGHYSLTFNKTGFNRFVREGIVLHVEVLSVDAELAVGNATQQVVVRAEASPLQTEQSGQATTFQAQVMTELPHVGQDWVGYLGKTLPGVTGSGVAISVNGTQKYQGSWLADGGTIVSPHSQNFETGLIESVDEVKINMSNFDAQYGTGTVIVNRLSKSGTNNFHGSVYEFLQNDFFNARSFFARSVPNLRLHQYGFTLGGPIKKGKLFFFYNLEKLVNNSASSGLYTYPTAAMKAGDFSNPVFPLIYDPASLANVGGQMVRQPFPGNKIPTTRLDPVALNIQKYFPEPNLPGFYANTYLVLLRTGPTTNHFGRMDYNISSSNRLTGSLRYRDTPESVSPAPICLTDCLLAKGYALQPQITDVWTFSPTVFNELRLVYMRSPNWFGVPSYRQGYPQKLGINYSIGDIFPRVGISGPVGATSIGTGGVISTLVDDTINPSDVVTLVRGRHLLKFGGEFQAYRDNYDTWGSINGAQFSFTGIATARAAYDPNSGLGYADFLTGQAASWQAAIYPMTGLRSKVAQLFVQDDFKIRPNLTLNLGLRWEVQTGWHEVGNRIALFDPSLMNPATNTPGAMWWAPNNGRTSMEATVWDIFLPRLGFAWSPTSKWSVRGGFGLFTYMWGTDTYGNFGRGLGYSTTGYMASTDGLTPVLTISDPHPVLNLIQPSANAMKPESRNGQPVTYIPYHAPAARIYEWSVSIQRDLSRGFVAEVAYVANAGTNLLFQRDINQVPENLLGPGNAQPRRPYPQFQGITANVFDAISNYNALQASLRKRFSNGLGFDLNYTWSKNLVTQDASGWGGQQGPATWQRSYAPDLNYGLSNNDVPHMFKGDIVYQLPFGKGKSLLSRGGLVDALVGGWQCSAIFFVQSGLAFTPVMGTTNLSGSLAGTWYPNRIANGTLSNPTIQRWFDTSAFAQPAQFTFGNSGRNVLRGPGMSDIDFSMAKAFGIPLLGEAGRLQIRVDATNVINHPSFSSPNASIGTLGAGVITSTSIGGRSLQLGARLSF